ncbi:hypothetical protein [Virgibacillus sp. DJP39]|uniref:hypothetical protein n=1 Tax=Virgibacillus sp. DJP39 TaxID=3409790 RepID=UPI003BB5291D
MNNSRNHKHIYDLCRQHMHAYVLAETNDGQKFDGIITGIDNENVYFAVPIDPNDPEMQMNNNSYREERYGFGGYGGYGYGYPGYGYGYGYGYGRPRRFNRLVLPLAALVALSTLSWY